MKIKANRKELAATLKTVSVCVQSRSILPILNNVLVEEQDGKLKLTCTNLEQRIYATMDAEITEPAAATIPAKKLLSLLDALTCADVVLDCNAENNHTTITGGSSKVTIPGLDPQDFPKFAELERKNTVSMKTSDLRKLIEHTQYAIDPMNARKVMAGMYFEASEMQITCVGTDGKRCAVSGVTFPDKCEEGFSRIIPMESLAFLRNLKQENVILVFDDGKHLVAFADNIVFECKLIEGNYPNWRQIVPASFKYHVEIPSADFLAKLNIMQMIMAENAFVNLKFRENRLDFHVDSATSGIADDSLEVKTDKIGTKDEIEMSFNPVMLSDAVKNCGAESFVFEFNDGMSPVNLRFGNDSFCVMMPMRKR